MKVKKPIISAEKEYEYLKQGLYKYMELQQKLISLKLTIVAAFFGFGLNSGNNILILTIPIIVLLFSIMFKGYTYYRSKIAYFIRKKYEHSESDLNWETYNHRSDIVEGLSFTKIFLGFGQLGLFLAWPIMAIFIGWVNLKNSLIERILLPADIIATLLIIMIFYFFNGVRLKQELERSRQLT